jgi:hypothetical protein
MISLGSIQREELRELLALLDHPEASLLHVHAQRTGRAVPGLEYLSPDELTEWLQTLRYAARRIEVAP